MTLLASSLLALLLSAGQAWAGDLSEATLNKLMDVSGVNKQTAAIPEMIKTSMDELEQSEETSGKQSPLTKEDFKGLKAALVDAFQVDSLLKATAARIRKNVSEADAKQVLGWLESDLGRKITQAEVDATNDEARGSMMNEARTLMADKERVALAHQLDKLLHATDEAINFRVEGETVMYVAVSKRLRPDHPVDAEAFKKQVASGIDRSSVEQSLILSFVYTYRNIDIPSLKKYVDFLGQPAMRRFNDAIRDGMVDGMNQCAAKAADNVAAFAKKKTGTGSAPTQR